MKLIRVSRSTKQEVRFHKNMGSLQTRVTYIRKLLFGIPIKTLHKYRDTYYGEVKACADCELRA
ncbi:hypothetical protein OZ410_01475 [Robiginitalea sp. M366]|uniref:hypothetical protein n=1 Tax=Robiginitalea aestuariiviva TaxID=3036903 RepID=UPI00240D228D|nr:hypothetical protein [Robiginitalea aestuariiviva]MDG1570969.1 hypothetical protein [Robiginitalea aestuariiviva]